MPCSGVHHAPALAGWHACNRGPGRMKARRTRPGVARPEPRAARLPADSVLTARPLRMPAGALRSLL